MLISLLFLFLIAEGFMGQTPDAVALVVLSGVAFVATDFKIPRVALSILAIPAGLIALGLLRSPGHAAVDIRRDFYYYAFPCLCLFTGCMLSRIYSRPEPILRVFIWAGVVLSVWQIIDVIVHRAAASDIVALREEISTGYTLSAIAPLILFLSLRFGVPLFTRNRKLITRLIYLVTLTGLAVAFSRTLTVCVVAALITGLGWLTRKRYRGVVVLAVGLLLLLNLSYFITVNPDTFLGKMAFVRDELFFTQFTGRADEIHHWRAYEAVTALHDYEKGDQVQKALGMGFGQLIDIGITIWFEGKPYLEIPVLHNGYLMALLKSGYVGLCLLLWYLARFYVVGARAADRGDPSGRFEGGLLMAMVTILLGTTYVASGWFNPGGLCPVMLLMGVLAQRLWLQPQESTAPVFQTAFRPSTGLSSATYRS